jgi:hypothetical protein
VDFDIARFDLVFRKDHAVFRKDHAPPKCYYLSTPRPRGNAVEPFDLYSPLIDADPFPYYAELREKYPCYWSDGAQLWILSRYDDIVEASRDWQTFSSAAGNMIDELPGRAGATLGTTDPPRHDRLRALSQAAFSSAISTDWSSRRWRSPIARSNASSSKARSSSSTIFPARSRSAYCSAPWACRIAIMRRSGAG